MIKNKGDEISMSMKIQPKEDMYEDVIIICDIQLDDDLKSFYHNNYVNLKFVIKSNSFAQITGRNQVLNEYKWSPALILKQRQLTLQAQHVANAFGKWGIPMKHYILGIPHHKSTEKKNVLNLDQKFLHKHF